MCIPPLPGQLQHSRMASWHGTTQPHQKEFKSATGNGSRHLSVQYCRKSIEAIHLLHEALILTDVPYTVDVVEDGVNDSAQTHFQDILYTGFKTPSTSSRATLETQWPSKGVPAFCLSAAMADIFVRFLVRQDTMCCRSIVIWNASASKTWLR